MTFYIKKKKWDKKYLLKIEGTGTVKKRNKNILLLIFMICIYLANWCVTFSANDSVAMKENVLLCNFFLNEHLNKWNYFIEYFLHIDKINLSWPINQ